MPGRSNVCLMGLIPREKYKGKEDRKQPGMEDWLLVHGAGLPSQPQVEGRGCEPQPLPVGTLPPSGAALSPSGRVPPQPGLRNPMASGRQNECEFKEEGNVSVQK